MRQATNAARKKTNGQQPAPAVPQDRPDQLAESVVSVRVARVTLQHVVFALCDAEGRTVIEREPMSQPTEQFPQGQPVSLTVYEANVPNLPTMLENLAAQELALAKRRQ